MNILEPWSDSEAARIEDFIFRLLTGLHDVTAVERASSWKDEDYKVLITVLGIPIYFEYDPNGRKPVIWQKHGYHTIPEQVFTYLKGILPLGDCQHDLMGFYNYTNVNLD